MFARDYAAYYGIFNSDKPYGDEIEFVYKWAENPDSIFDIGCGLGDYWKHYPEEVKILGVERSLAMISQSSRYKNIICAEIENYKPDRIFDCATALFDVINYIPKHDWWKNIPIKKGGYFIFDIWDKEKVDKDGFKRTQKTVGPATRTIQPIFYAGKTVSLEITVEAEGKVYNENHAMLVWSHEDIEKFCGEEFEIVETKETESWQKWYKLRRK